MNWKALPKCTASKKPKTRFPSERSADGALDRMWRRAIRYGSKVGMKMPCRAYRCRVCKGWHLTSEKSRTLDEV